MIFKRKLAEYIEQSSPLLEQVYHEQKMEAEKVGRVPAELLDDFFEHARRGKKLRGFLTVLGYRLVGGEINEKILRASLVVELFHAGLLVEDDVMDGSVTRRGQETIHVKYGKYRGNMFGSAMAICAADIAYYMSWRILLDSEFASETLNQAGKIYTEHALRVICGQVLDVSSGQGKRLNKQEIEQISWIKSGDYSAWFPLKLGMTLAGSENEKLNKQTKEYAECLGWAFQLRDDWLGTFGDKGRMGKPVVDDLRDGKQTLLVWHLRKHGTKKQVKYLESVLGDNQVSEAKVNKMREMYDEVGSKTYLESRGDEYVIKGQKMVKEMRIDAEIKQILSQMLEHVTKRDS